MNSQKLKSLACIINFGYRCYLLEHFSEPDVFGGARTSKQEEEKLLMENLLKLLKAFYDSSDDFNLRFNCDGGALNIQHTDGMAEVCFSGDEN